MRQIFLLILLFVVGQWLVKALRRADANQSQRSGAAGGPGAGSAQRTAKSAGAQRGPAQAPRLAEPMIRCAECGVHAPASDSIVVAGEPFCCPAHAKRHATPPTGRDAR